MKYQCIYGKELKNKMKGATQMTKKEFLAKFSVLITLNRRIIRTEREITKLTFVLPI